MRNTRDEQNRCEKSDSKPWKLIRLAYPWPTSATTRQMHIFILRLIEKKKKQMGKEKERFRVRKLSHSCRDSRERILCHSLINYNNLFIHKCDGLCVMFWIHWITFCDSRPPHFGRSYLCAVIGNASHLRTFRLIHGILHRIKSVFEHGTVGETSNKTRRAETAHANFEFHWE